MCGISGYISERQLVQKEAISNTIKLMKLRGPDANNYILKEYPSKKVALLHSRLSILISTTNLINHLLITILL